MCVGQSKCGYIKIENPPVSHRLDSISHDETQKISPAIQGPTIFKKFEFSTIFFTTRESIVAMRTLPQRGYTMSFPARFAGRCATCAKPINKGQYITWSRREKGKAYHADCENPNVVPSKDVSVPPFHTTTPAEIMAAMAKMLEAMGHKPTASLESIDLTAEPPAISLEEVGAAIVGSPKALPAKASTGLDQNAPWFDVLSTLVKGVATDGGLFRVLLLGPPSTGKSTTAMKVTETQHRVTMTEGSGVEDLIGMYQLKAGETVWCDGPVTTAMREGQPILIDEIDHHSTEIGSLLYAVLDDNPQIMLPTGESVVAQPGYGVIATTNSNVTSLPDAILDRFEAVLIAKEPHPASLAGLTTDMSGAVVSYFRSLKADPWKWSGKPTVRRMRAYNRMLPILGSAHAASLAFGTAGAEIESILTTSGRIAGSL